MRGWHERCFQQRRTGTHEMRPSRILSLLASCTFCWACASTEPELPLTPAAYTTPPPSKPPPRTKRTESRPPPSAKPAPEEAEAKVPVVTGMEGGDSRKAIAIARCQREARCGYVGAEKEY